MTNHDTPKLTPREASERLGFSASRLAKLRMSGEGPAFFKLGHKVMYAIGDIDAWLAERRTTKTPATRSKGVRRKAKPADTSDQRAAA